MKQLPLILAGLVLWSAAALPARGCLNDRDTLAEEAKGLPDVVQVVVGRFPRNPPLYYEMRIDRVAKDIAAHPGNLSEYNDIAVACDRIGRDDEAIAWMNRKRAEMDKLPAAQVSSEDRYTYWADIGTSRIHRWIRHGADRKKIAEARQAESEIAQALKIKPDAHFGREKYQLQVIDWMLLDRTAAPDSPDLATYLEQSEPNPDDVRRGLCGLIVLGNAWESPDIFNAIAGTLGQRSKLRVQDLCRLRVAELVATGHPGVDVDSETARYYELTDQDTKQQYRMLRKEADTWQAKRTAFMMARLQAGRHPDTDPHFWDGYVEASPPELAIPLARRIELWGRPYFGVGWFPRSPIAIALILAPIVWLVRRDLRRWRERRHVRSAG